MRSSKWGLLLVLVVVVMACGPPTSAPTTVETSSTQSTSPPPSDATSTSTSEGQGGTDQSPALQESAWEIAEGAVTLLRYLGDVRASRDGGESWFYADSGFDVAEGDRVQVATGGIALIIFPDGSLIRLEGYSDFQLIRAEFDPTVGSKRITGRLWDGSALVSTVPLPTPDSLFQLWATTTFIDLPYDEALATSFDDAFDIPEEDRIVFGAVVSEAADGEVLLNYPDSVLPGFYSLEVIDGELVMIRTRPSSDQITELRVPFRDEVDDELELERMLDVIATLVDQERSATAPGDVDFFGYTMVEQGALAENQTLFLAAEAFDLPELLAESDAERQDFVRFVANHRRYFRYAYAAYSFIDIPDIFSSELLMQLEALGLGCDITTGLGCPIPAGCNTDTGEGCTFVSGCNMITREGCTQARLRCVTTYHCVGANCPLWLVKLGITTTCRPDVRTYCDPNVPGDCDRYLRSGESITPAEVAAPERVPDPLAPADALFDFFLPSSIPVELVEDAAKAGQPVMSPNEPETCTPFVNVEFWSQEVRTASGGFAADDTEDDDEEWCTCRATVPPGYPPPPPWKDMEYRCWCTDPGAYHGSKG